jgi:FlaA1/EpsC-like NDP-sugar epimerase
MIAHPKNHYKNKVVCVTGAGGSIGSELCKRLVEYEVSRLILVGHSEIGLYNTERALKDVAPAGTVRTVLGSVTDQKLMERTFETNAVEIVIHAAAHKHVPLCEENPIDAVLNNVGGTIALAEAASRFGVKQFIQVSTDKAVKPASIMGATKRACELFLDFLRCRTSMRISIVRFGNVLNSSGSVLPLWREQIKAGKPITLTDKRCTRFFMSIPEAVDLTLGAGSLPRDGLYVLDMGEPKNMYDMAREVVLASDPPIKFKGADVIFDTWNRITETGLRPGEKLTEELSYGGDLVKTSIPKVNEVREGQGKHILRWADFHDLLMAARCRHRQMTLDQLWSIVR